MSEYSKEISSILNKARELEGFTLKDKCWVSDGVGEATNFNKGSFGQLLEEVYFGIKNNNLPKPDFWPIPLELKSAPLKQTSNNQLIPKERIVLNIINYDDIAKETFETSHFKFKNDAILIVWYLYSKIAEAKDMPVQLADIWHCIQEDGKQIEEDWNIVANKVKEGHAEDISEGDTLFLGACTKGSTADTSYRKQPNSDILAKQRAFCFKMSYVKHIYSVMCDRKNNRIEQSRFMPLGETKTLEDIVIDLFKPFYGKTSHQIENDLHIHTTAKSRYAMIARTIIGYSQKNNSFYEFDAANIQIKTVRVEKSGKPKEDMSFKNIKFKEIVSQEWEDSDLYQELISKFIFVVFRVTPDGTDYYLDKVKFWNMPEADLDKVKTIWEKTKLKTIRGEYDSLPKKSEHPIIHVRTKGKDSLDLTETPIGTFITKRCFFLNNTYIRAILSK